MKRFGVALVALLAPFSSMLGACGESEGAEASDAGSAAARVDGRVTLDGAACLATVESPLVLAGSHVPVGTPVVYNSQPPSSGPHYPVWAAYTTFTKPLDPRYWVHNLEHGGVVFLYKCETATSCPDLVQGIEDAVRGLFDDPICARANEGVRVRTLIAPDPTLDAPIVAVSWGWIYRAQCVDVPTLRAFAQTHYGQGTEVNCAQGERGL